MFTESLRDVAGRYPGPASDVFWQFSTPEGLRAILTWIGRRYSRPEVWVTENGLPAPGEAAKGRRELLRDVARLEFYRCARARVRCDRLRAAQQAMMQSACAWLRVTSMRARPACTRTPACALADALVRTVSVACNRPHTRAAQVAPGRAVRCRDPGRRQCGRLLCLEPAGHV